MIGFPHADMKAVYSFITRQTNDREPKEKFEFPVEWGLDLQTEHEDGVDPGDGEHVGPEADGEKWVHQAVLVAWPSRPLGRNNSATISTTNPIASL